MNKLFQVLFFYLLSISGVLAQQAESNIPIKADSLLRQTIGTKKQQAFTQQILNQHPYFNFHEKAVYPAYKLNPPAPNKDLYFYIIAGLFLMFAILKTGFDKYFSDLITLFFRRSLKQRQLKQQLVQNSLPSLLFNILFATTIGFYIAMAIHNYVIMPQIAIPLWQLFIYATAAIGLIYLCKYFLLKFIGWVFNISVLTDNYIFQIFLINKIITFLLLPLIIVIALANKPFSTIAWTLSWLLIIGFILYRYVSAARLVKQNRSISFFHFILYVGAFEVLPTVMLYKGILTLLK